MSEIELVDKAFKMEKRVFRTSKKALTDFTYFIASDTVRKSKPFDPLRQAMSVSARILGEDKDKKTTITSAVHRLEENAHLAKWDEQIPAPQKGADLEHRNDKGLLRSRLYLERDNVLGRLQGINSKIENLSRKEINNEQEMQNRNRKGKGSQESKVRERMFRVKTRFVSVKIPSGKEKQFQEDKKQHYAPLAKACGILVEEYFKKLDQKSLQISENKEICTRINSNVLKNILKQDDPKKRRFMTQFETGTSNSLIDLGFYRRRMVERDTLGNYDVNMKDNHYRIIYGYLAKSDQVRGPYNKQGKFYLVDQYGDVVIIFKRTEEFKRRTSFTVGDSLDHTGRVKGVPYENPNGDCFAWGEPGFPEGMDPLDIEEFDALPVYVEAQIHYGVSLKDIARVVLMGKAAQDKELIDLLKDHKIRVNRDLH